jgi:hypothetical protein
LPAGGGDIIPPGHYQYFTAQYAAETSPIHQNNSENHFVETNAKADHQDQRENDRRKRHPHVDGTADNPIDSSAEVAGDMRQD